MNEVSKDIIKAATVMTKSLMVLGKFAHEIGILNGALALLGNANHRNNLTRKFIIKREINHAQLCSDKALMTRLLFGDDTIC